MTKRKVGFTLIELLVVIAIISVLAAILFPVFARAKAKAKQAQCLSNMKQSILGFQIYCSDYDGFVPTKVGSDKVPATVRYPWHLLKPYVQTWEVMECPLSGGTFKSPRHPRFAPSYHTFGQGWKATLSSCTQPADTAYFSESYAKEYAQHAFVCNVWSNSPKYAHNSKVDKYWAPAHGTGNNFGYVDGHAKFDAGQSYRKYSDWRYLVEWQK